MLFFTICLADLYLGSTLLGRVLVGCNLKICYNLCKTYKYKSKYGFGYKQTGINYIKNG